MRVVLSPVIEHATSRPLPGRRVAAQRRIETWRASTRSEPWKGQNGGFVSDIGGGLTRGGGAPGGDSGMNRTTLGGSEL